VEAGRGRLSLEWLRSLHVDDAREYLMSVGGLGRKSTACVLLLALGMKDFPVDVNVARIAARLGWIPIEVGRWWGCCLLHQWAGG
jgi:endonuclease III